MLEKPLLMGEETKLHFKMKQNSTKAYPLAWNNTEQLTKFLVRKVTKQTFFFTLTSQQNQLTENLI